MIVADQHRADALGCAGKFRIKTPNLDALAESGARFENAFTPLPVCTPARQSLICGKNPDSYGAFWNPGFFHAAPLAPGGYWPEKLKAAGYRTAFLGKWEGAKDYGPKDFGYDKYVDFREHDEMIREKYPKRRRFDWFGGKSDIALADSRTHYLARKAAETIAEYSEKGGPWHIRVDYCEPHLPCEPSEPFASMYSAGDIEPWDGVGDTFEGKPYIQKQQLYSWGLEKMGFGDWAEPIARYYGMVSQIDDSVGIILKALKDCGQLSNTIILYTSDHGDMCGSHGMIDKHYVLYDDVVKVPFIMSGPGIGKGAVVKELVSSGLDLAPTIDELFGAESAKAQGVSLAPLLRGERPENWRQEINASSNGQQFGFYNQRMLRDRRFKYIWNFTDIDEFYDLENDPGEKKNLISSPEHAERIAAMRKKLLAVLKEQGDLFVKSGWLDRQLADNKKL